MYPHPTPRSHPSRSRRRPGQVGAPRELCPRHHCGELRLNTLFYTDEGIVNGKIRIIQVIFFRKIGIVTNLCNNYQRHNKIFFKVFINANLPFKLYHNNYFIFSLFVCTAQITSLSLNKKQTNWLGIFLTFSKILLTMNKRFIYNGFYINMSRKTELLWPRKCVYIHAGHNPPRILGQTRFKT